MGSFSCLVRVVGFNLGFITSVCLGEYVAHKCDSPLDI